MSPLGGRGMRPRRSWLLGLLALFACGSLPSPALAETPAVLASNLFAAQSTNVQIHNAHHGLASWSVPKFIVNATGAPAPPSAAPESDRRVPFFPSSMPDTVPWRAGGLTLSSDGTATSTISFDFNRGEHGFVADFADYPLAHREPYDLTSGYRALPAPLESWSALFIGGNNHSDDLFMFFKGQVRGLVPGARYAVSIGLEIATAVPAGCFGIGGAPGEAVYVKAGVSEVEPVPVLDESGALRMNIDKGNQARGGENAVVLGDIANSRQCEEAPQWERKSFNGRSVPTPVTASQDGRVWLLFGVDSGFEGRTELYFTRVSLTVTRNGGGNGGGGGSPPPAALHNLFEWPTTRAVVSGTDLIRGWSFAEAARVSIEEVTLYVNRRPVAVIPCCSARADVAQAHPRFPRTTTGQSGWGMIYNWGNLPAGPHTLQVVVTSSDGGRWRSPRHRLTVLKPGNVAFADRMALAEAEARLEGEHLVLSGVVLRDKATQAEHELALRYAWQTGAQGLRLVASRPLATARVPPGRFPPLLARVGQWAAQWLWPAEVTANEGITATYEAPADQAAVAGIGLIRGWAFPEDPTDMIEAVTVAIDDARQESAPCCSTRGDVAAEYPDAAQAELSGWGLVFNYGNLATGEHDLTAQIVTAAGRVYEETHTVRVARLGGFAFVDRFALSGATVDLEGEEVILSGVTVRDKVTQAEQTIEVRLRWAAATQGLVIVDSTTLP